MNWLKQLFSRRPLFGDHSEKIREHLGEKAEALVTEEMSRKDAGAAVHHQFRNGTLIEDDRREVWRWPSLEGFFMDVRYGARLLRKNAGFTIVPITSLALAIGANTAIFSLLNGLALRALPVPQPRAARPFRGAKRR